MKITTENILKMLARDSNQALKLVEIFNAFDDDQKYLAEKKIWDLYDELYDVRLKSNLQKAFAEVKKGKRNLSADFYKKVKEETDKEIEKQFHQDTTSVDLNSVRDKISKIIGA